MAACHSLKKMKINKDKRIGRVLFIVEGSHYEFVLLKRIFCNILGFSYIEKDGTRRITISVKKMRTQELPSSIHRKAISKILRIMRLIWKTSLQNSLRIISFLSMNPPYFIFLTGIRNPIPMRRESKHIFQS